DAEAHTNPVYVDLNDKAPYSRAALDRLVERIDQQMIACRNRQFPEKARVLDDFQKSSDILLAIRAHGGRSARDASASRPDGEEASVKDPGARSHSDEELKRFLQPIPPKPPPEALRAIEAVDGFRVELVAAEPMVASPVAAAFDEDGDLYVAEMRDYPFL